MSDPLIVVSVSGGKDSTATLLLALERFPAERIRAVFADTGNEHQITYDYVKMLSERVHPIHTLRPDFSDWWWRRRDYVRDKWIEKMTKVTLESDIVGEDGKKLSVRQWLDHEIFEIRKRALEVFDRGPTGNPYLDLCIIKGRFPSRRAQFCTQYLKTEPLVEYQLGLVDKFGAVESWQGVRADESANRAQLPDREDRGGGLTVFRPILRWNVDEVFAQHRKHGIEPNPLYKLGMSRVGCMPCINTNKDEVLSISKRFPDEIGRIANWESVVSDCARQGVSTFFHFNYQPDEKRRERKKALADSGIHAVVQWSKTRRGGREADWIKTIGEPEACASAYGLCE